MMHLKIKVPTLLLAGALSLAIPVGSALANCPSAPIAQGFSSSFEQCGGTSAAAFVWFHGHGVQRTINSDASGSAALPGGHDSGHLQNAADSVFTDGPLGMASGSYLSAYDFANTGSDGCMTTDPAFKTTCICATLCPPGSTNFGVVDYAIGGVDAAAPNIGRTAAVSVDFNENQQLWILDQAGAASINGNACDPNGDANAFIAGPVNCGAIPVPQITGSSPTAGGSNLVLSVGSSAAIPLLDDCNVAEDKATNCLGPAGNKRNLYAGRVLMFRHGNCAASASAAFDRRSWVYPPAPPSGSLVVAGNWMIYSQEDANLDGLLTVGEDGTHGGTVNGILDPFIVAGTAAATPTVFVPAVNTATDCIFFALGIGMDTNKLAVDPPTNSIFGDIVISPVVSVNGNPIHVSTGTPVSDVVTVITASKSQGKGSVNWETGIEMTTSGFNVIGTKKNGGETKLNGSLIAAKEGTTGRGATYTVTFDAAQLKGSSSVFVEIVKTDGSKERFGPASF